MNSTVTNHYKNKRYKRENFINKYIHGDGKVVDTFIIDRGHKNGLERHEITENGIILIYNNTSNALISKLIARPNQIQRYYKKEGREPPPRVMYLSQWHKDLGYNK